MTAFKYKNNSTWVTIDFDNFLSKNNPWTNENGERAVSYVNTTIPYSLSAGSSSLYNFTVELPNSNYKLMDIYGFTTGNGNVVPYLISVDNGTTGAMRVGLRNVGTSAVNNVNCIVAMRVCLNNLLTNV